MNEQTSARVVHVKDHIEGAVYIGRPMPRQKLRGTIWANPYKIGQGVPRFHDGTVTMEPMTRQNVIALYRYDITQSRFLLRELPTLRGKTLACWCRHHWEKPGPGNACHGDVLLEMLAQYTDDDLMAMADNIRSD